MKNNNRRGINVVDIAVVFAIIVILCALLLPAINRVPFNAELIQVNNCLCVKTFEKNNGSRISDLIVVFEKNDKTYILDCTTPVYSSVLEGKYYDIEYTEAYFTAYGYTGTLINAVKVYQSQKDKE